MAVDSAEEFQRMISNSVSKAGEASPVLDAAKEQSEMRRVSEEALKQAEDIIREKKEQDK